MADKTYGTIVTDCGIQLIAAAVMEGKKVNITDLAVGDGGGSYYKPNSTMTALKGEKWRGKVNRVEVNEKSPNMIDVVAVIPSDVGGWTIREMGVLDETETLILWLVDLIVDSTENPGIPIGNQTSQWFAVMYLSGMDHFIKEKLGIRYYGRYMDDFYLIHEDKAYLQYCRGEIEQYVARLGLRMNKKTNIFPLRNGIDFLGFHTYLTESGKIIRKVRRSSKCNAQRKLKKQRGLLDREKISLSDIEQSYGSWRSHAVKGNCYHLIQKTDSLFQNLFKESEKQWPKV